MEPSFNHIIISFGEPKKPANNIIYMDVSLYKAAAVGKIEEFNNYRRPELESLKTPNHDNVLHVNLSTSECIGQRSRSDFIEQILFKCPSLLRQTNAKGQTPLHVAARNGHSAIVKLLIKSRAKATDEDLKKLGMDQLNAVREMLRNTDQESNTALHVAARYEATKIIVENKGDMTKETDENGHTPLHYAAHLGHDSVVEELLKWDLLAAYVGDKEWEMTPLLMAARQGHGQIEQIMELLKDITNEEVAEKPVRPIPSITISADRLEKEREVHLVVAALIATVTFAAAITVPGGLKKEKGSEQGIPFLIHDATFKAFIVTDALAFLFSLCALLFHFGMLPPFSSIQRPTFLSHVGATTFLGYATYAMVIAFCTTIYVVLKPSYGLSFVC
ncbi:hypothetical protein GOBAR_DD35297 [Gossypium barbadense]|nr:hypothetical protein GOBAR_DD35297 [Gossypium barbadense]